MGRRNKSLVLSYKGLRSLIGILGMALPVVCYLGGLIFGGHGLQRSISLYYYTNVRDFFIGLMLGMAFFMMTYKGHELIDTIANLATGIAGVCVGLFPCLAAEPDARVGFFQLREVCSNVVHTTCAAIFFAILAFSCLLLFTRTHSTGTPTDRKKMRNVVYIICGWIMVATLVVLGILLLVLDPTALQRTKVEFICETILLEAFGISWLVKGEAILGDR